MKSSRLKAIVAHNIKTLRERRGLSQDKLGEIVGRTWQSISNLETGKTLPPLNTLAAIATALGVPPATLLTENAAPPADPRTDLLTQAQTMLADMPDAELETAVKVVRALREGR